MQKGRALLRGIGIIVAVAMTLFLVSSPAVFGINAQPKVMPEIRADIIDIDSMKVFGKLERPSVTYLHQRHTEALAKKNKDCRPVICPKKTLKPEKSGCPPNICGLKTPPGRR